MKLILLKLHYINNKIGYVTENRKEEGLFLEHSVVMNICVNSLQKCYYKRIPVINLKTEEENADIYVKKC